MRQRFIKDSLERIESNERYFIANPTEHKGKWNEVFSNNNPIHIEIGCGKGQFILALAIINPNINYIAIERVTSVLLRTSQKLEEQELSNIKIINVDAANLADVFVKEEVERIYLNFSDPWPKNAHKKRRLTHQNFLNVYKNILVKEGEIHFKTDNRGLFEFTLEEFNNNGLLMSHISLDLHNSDFKDNITTEYEDKFSSKGPIYRLEARFK